jgi:hypothetical protein
MAPTAPPLLNLAEMSRAIGVTAAWLRSEAEGGRVPCLAAGKTFLFCPPAVERVLAERAARLPDPAGAGDRPPTGQQDGPAGNASHE